MKCRIFIVLVLMFALSPLAMAQDFKMELTPFFSYTLSEGTNVNFNTGPSRWSHRQQAHTRERLGLGFSGRCSGQ